MIQINIKSFMLFLFKCYFDNHKHFVDIVTEFKNNDFFTPFCT